MSTFPPANFDRIAAPYRWLEYATLGPVLTRCRNHFLAALGDRRRAVILGDGDGRFTARLLASNPYLHADAVDLSPAMLKLLTRRAQAAHPTAADRLRTHVADARCFSPTGTYDLIVTHFFVDCLTDADLRSLANRLQPHLTRDALWLVSEFRIPTGLLRLPAQALVRSLYLAFRLLSNLRITHLPDHVGAFKSAGLGCTAQHLSFGGMLTTEIWSPGHAYTSGANPAYSPTMQLPPQKPRTPHLPDPVPDPEPASPSLPEPDPAVFHPEPPAKTATS